MYPKIYTIGEIILDIIFKDDKPVSANPGGSKLNSAVTLGRLGLPISFIGEIGNDEVALLITEFLRKNSIDTRFLNRIDGLKSSLALAFLDENNEARYSFYKYNPEEGLQFDLPPVNENDLLLFGSFYSISKEYHHRLFNFVSRAKKNNALVIYDPNIRRPHKNQLPDLADLIRRNISQATIVRASDEDMYNILGTDNPEYAYDFVKECGCNILILTRSKHKVYVFNNKRQLSFDVPTIQAVSTIGAGDTFNAGIIYWCFRNKVSVREICELSQENWKQMIETAVDMSQIVCCSIENYLPLKDADDFIKKTI